MAERQKCQSKTNARRSRYETLSRLKHIVRAYLMSVSSSTTTSHLVFGTELLRNRCRIAKVLPQWPAKRDVLSIHQPVQLIHILTRCCDLVYKDKWPCIYLQGPTCTSVTAVAHKDDILKFKDLPQVPQVVAIYTKYTTSTYRKKIVTWLIWRYYFIIIVLLLFI